MQGLTTIESRSSPKETMDRLEAEILARGMQVFARIDHAAGAAEAGLELTPTELIIFGQRPDGHAPDAGQSDHGHRPAAQGARVAGRGGPDVAFPRSTDLAGAAARDRQLDRSHPGPHGSHAE
jgi:hypothetical protein